MRTGHPSQQGFWRQLRHRCASCTACSSVYPRATSSKLRLRTVASWVGIGCFLFGVFLYFGIAGFSFSAYICFGLGALTWGYQFLHWLKKRRPKAQKILWWTVTILVAIGLLLTIITGCFVGSACSGTPQQECGYLIVLGAGVNGTNPSYILRTRINAAAEYMQSHPGVVCVVSGGQGNGEDISEAECMYRWLTDKGVAAERIIMEDKATSTEENLRFSLEIGGKTGFESYAVVTADYHVCRAGLIAEKMGISAEMVAAETEYPVLAINYYFREAVALWYYELLEII